MLMQRRLKRIKKRASGLKVIKQGSHGLQMLSIPIHLTKTAFNWVEDGWVPAPDVEVVATITTWHKYGYPGFFKPSIGEIASQIPGELVGKIDCFMTEFVGLEEPFHVGRTTLFRFT